MLTLGSSLYLNYNYSLERKKSYIILNFRTDLSKNTLTYNYNLERTKIVMIRGLLIGAL
jgi:hypothetical protein